MRGEDSRMSGGLPECTEITSGPVHLRVDLVPDNQVQSTHIKLCGTVMIILALDPQSKFIRQMLNVAFYR